VLQNSYKGTGVVTTGNVTAVALRDAPLAVVFTPDSGHAYVCNVRSLTVIDTTTNDVDEVDIADLPRGLQLSPDGKRAYITNLGADGARPARRRGQLNRMPGE
jgi:YVTN family beta-propeller protein